MQRRTAVAAASAISMSLLSAVVAVSAHLGALGFTAAASNPRPVIATAAPTVVAQPTAGPAGSAATATPTSRTWHDDDAHEHAAATVTASTVRTGAHDD